MRRGAAAKVRWGMLAAERLHHCWQRVRVWRQALNQRRSARLARLAGWLCAVVSAAIVSTLHDPRVAFDVVAKTLGWLTWCAAAPVAWSLAGAHGDEAAIAALAALTGRRPHRRDRLLAGAFEMALRVALPAAVVVLVAAGATRVRVLLALVVVVPFAVVGAAVLAASAALCRRVAGRRGRSVWLAVVVLPWVLADVLHARALSLPGALAGALAGLRHVVCWGPGA